MSMTPREIVHELDRHIVGQSAAKRAVSIALRNRWRRMQLAEDFRGEITPKNILMIGPTGVGKTEIARRLAKLANAPFIKVEATKFTEVGYVGRDVESIIRDLVDVAIKNRRESAVAKVDYRASEAAEERILDVLLPPARDIDENDKQTQTRQLFRKKLREGELDEKEINIELSDSPVGIEIMAPPGMEDMTNQLQGMFSNFTKDKKTTRKLMVKDAFKQLKDEEANKLINQDELKADAIQAAEQTGIVFIDEIDKVAKRQEASGGDVSREGVQRDLLPLIEGSTVSTKHGSIKTDHILFIASGAFHLSKPSDLIPELQGRLPIRVELDPLSADDFEKILTEPHASLTEQYQALLGTEGLNLEFTPDGISRIAKTAWQVNEKTENIGARRLHTILERLLESASFEASDLNGQKITIAASPVSTFVFQRYCAMMRRNDLLLDPRFITAQFRRDNWEDLLAEIRAWVLTFRTIEELEAQVSEAGLAVGTIRSVSEIAESEWAIERGAIREVEDRSGGTARVPSPPWIFGGCDLPDAGLPPFQGEHNLEVLRSLGLSEDEIENLEATGVLISNIPKSN